MNGTLRAGLILGIACSSREKNRDSKGASSDWNERAFRSGNYALQGGTEEEQIGGQCRGSMVPLRRPSGLQLGR